MDSTAPRGIARRAPLAMDAEQFRALGHSLVDQIASLLESMPRGPVTRDESPADVRAALALNGGLPAEGTDAEALLISTARQLFAHSLFNGHPRFFGYVTSSPAPIGMLGDLLASAINPNVGAWKLSPAASEIEGQAIRWMAELIGYPTDCGGILVSGGNMANFVCFFAARAARAGFDIRREGVSASSHPLTVYASAETHTWIQKATDLAGLGTDSIRWIPTDSDLRMDVTQLERRIDADIAEGRVPLIVIATAGSVSTGAVDPLRDIA
ncbi:MAG TPA: pyridoxal-dependent decarboxylase, partial [Vicinamibacterales bacterium]|nr:pyridoxal-dependent decarboxylase [Vicinamibacterales bacterium]